MMQSSLGNKAIQEILELSADLQIKRRASSKYSLAFHECSVAIAAYGRALALLTALLQQEEYCANFRVLCSLESMREAAS